MPPIYLDSNATTPVDPAVADAMLPYLRDHFGNPSSGHAYGTAAREAVEQARRQVADLIGAEPDEIVFTSGGSEATNLAIKGVCMPGPKRLREGRPFRVPLLGHLRLGPGEWVPGRFTALTTAVEHPATAATVEHLRALGVRVHIVGVDRYGRVDPDAVRRRLRGFLWTGYGFSSQTVVSVMHSNNETGTLMPVAEIGEICRDLGIRFHTDAAQSLGKVPVNVRELRVDLLTIAGHKMYAPKGVGVLYVRRGIDLEPLIHGAGHESGRRAGTENVPYIVGLGKAAEIAQRALPQETERLRHLRDRLHKALLTALGDRLVLNGHPELRLPNTLNVSFVGHVGAELLAKVPDVAASTGSACHEGTVKLSPVLAAMGVSRDVGKGAVRLTVGRFTTADEVDRAAALLATAATVTR